MTVAIRVALVLIAVLVVIAGARLIGSWQRPSHPPIDPGDFGPRPGVMLFTSTDCENCKEALRRVGALGAEVREVTWELEPAVFKRVGVEAVPLTAVVDEAGRVELLAAGVPRKNALKRAMARAGLLDQ